MILFFGKYSYRIKKISQKAVDVDGKGKRDVDFILKMRVTHIMFIPLMGLEKFWKVVDSHTGEVIEDVDEAIEKKLQVLKLETKTPAVVFAYTGVILPILLFAYFIGSFIFTEVGTSIGSTRKSMAYLSQMKEEIEDVDKGDIYLFKILFLKRDSHSLKKKMIIDETKQVSLKLTEVKDDNYHFSLLSTKQYETENYRKFLSQLPNNKKISISREQLLEAAEYGDPSKNGGIRINSLSSESPVFLYRIIDKQ